VCDRILNKYCIDLSTTGICHLKETWISNYLSTCDNKQKYLNPELPVSFLVSRCEAMLRQVFCSADVLEDRLENKYIAYSSGTKEYTLNITFFLV